MAIKSYPKSIEEIADKVVMVGGFMDAYNFLMKNVKAKDSTSLIVKGSIGTGKKTLIRTFKGMNNTHIKPQITLIELNPYYHTDDYSAVKYLAKELGLKPTTSIKDILEDITKHGTKSESKIVIILYDFEVFCRQKQSLLYCLTNLTQHCRNFSLIGLTMSIDCLENLEKRIRSRLNANFYSYQPYKTKDEFIDFAQSILGNYKLSVQFKDELEIMWSMGNRSIRTLKRYLIAHCSWSKRGVFSVCEPKEELSFRYGKEIHSLEQRLSWLTRPQMDLLILAIAYCNDLSTQEFSLMHLGEYAARHNYQSFNPEDPITLKSAALLSKIGLFKQVKLGQMISLMTVFSYGVSPMDFKVALERNSDFQSLKMIPFWKKW